MSLQSRNFAFMKEVDPPLYQYLCDAEQKAYIDAEDACKEIGRHVLERFINICIDDHFKGVCREQLKAISNASDKLGILTDASKLKQYGYLKGNERLTDKNRIIKCGTASVHYTERDMSGKIYQRSDDVITFLRGMGNATAHREYRTKDDKKVVLNFDNLLTAIREFHVILKCYYNPGNRLGVIPKFDENLISIGEYEIIKSYIPADKEWSKCGRECLTFRRNDRDRISKYALLRMYHKKNFSEKDAKNVILRNQRSFEHASKQQESDSIPGIPTFITLSASDNGKSDFYIIGYEFDSKPEKLEAVLPEMDQKTRLSICATLLRAMDELHHFELPMYHRVLNHECIWVRKLEGRNKYLPYILKFDYTKIHFGEMHKTFMMMERGDSSSSAGAPTVYQQMVKAGSRSLQNHYRSPIWESLTDAADDEYWRAIDVYSLGVLVTDILYGKLIPRAAGGNLIAPEDELRELSALKESGGGKIAIDSELCGMLESMLQDDLYDLMEVSLYNVASALDERARRS